MIEIIRHGNYVHVYKCLKCGCLFRANKNDINYVDSSGSDVGYIHCPECANLVRKEDFIDDNQETINIPSCWKVEDHNKKYEAIHTSATTDDCIKRQ